MKKLTFKCTLLSDIIINRKSATVGNQLTLDFIPGNNFYGIVANKLYKDNTISDDVRYTILHSGKVRFGDAHPSLDNVRAYHVPAAMFYPKLDGIENTYINHAVADGLNGKVINRSHINGLQLKQCRTGFYTFQDDKGTPVDVAKTFSLKSAYDRDQRRAKDSQMFGYESINKGLELMFEIYVDDDVTTNIASLLIGTQRVGRSRTAQYGLVKIEQIGTTTDKSETLINAGAEFYVYADSRLILKDEYGNASTDAKYIFPQDECELILEKTQVRVFQYSPWNYKRQSHDTDRYGIEKGSVIALRAKKSFTASHFVGLYQAEGFGHILINPEFLNANNDGTAKFKLQKSVSKNTPIVSNEDRLTLIQTSDLRGIVKNLALKSNDERCRQYIYKVVSDFVSKYQFRFAKDGKTFASQWGNIRSIAASSNTLSELTEQLYGNQLGYLMHGVAKDKWSEQKRLELLKEFINSAKEAFNNSDYSNRYVPMAVVNLASEMAKKCKSKSN
jgi:hypothetical protein